MYFSVGDYLTFLFMKFIYNLTLKVVNAVYCINEDDDDDQNDDENEN